jgi:hypothetical protein
MKRLFLLCCALCLALAAIAQTTTRAQRNPRIAVSSPATKNPPLNLLPLKRVILYSNGVAYFERRGKVSGKAEINLAFKQSQVDDVLKSLVVLDLGKGRVGAVSYNSSAPPSARLNEIPFSIEAATDDSTTGGLAGVLQQLQGAKVSVTTSTRTATGSIITIGERQIAAGMGDDKVKSLVKTHTIILASESGELQSFDLNEVRAVRLLDEGAKSDLNQFAEASASARRRDAKTITVTSEGEAEREMVVSYTVATPIWKTTYRVVLDQTGKPFFQGWAIVDNVGEEDWTDVALSMVSGTPVSFIQPIQKPMYRYRPIVPIPQDLNLNPQVYDPEAGVGSGVGMGQGIGMGAGQGGSLSALGGLAKNEQARIVPPPAGPSAYQQAQTQSLNVDAVANATGFARPATSVSDALTGGTSGVETAAQGEEVGELFEYRIEQPVTVRKDRSALIPILQTKMEGERVSLFNEATRRDRPMNGIRLKNTSKLTLEGGALTVLDGDAYAGEALIERLKPEEQRFISFGLDLGTLVTTKFKSERRPVFLVRARNGVFETHYYLSETKTYTIINQTDKERVLYIEHPLRTGWKLADAVKPTSQTLNYYRFRVELKPGARVEFPVSETQALMDSYQLSNISTRDVELFITNRYIDAKTRVELEKLVEIKGRIDRTHARIQTLESEAEEIDEDQKRLRENIKSLKDTVDAKQLIARYIAKADQQETRLEQINREKKEAQAEAGRLQAELAAAIKAMNLENPL